MEANDVFWRYWTAIEQFAIVVDGNSELAPSNAVRVIDALNRKALKHLFISISPNIKDEADGQRKVSVRLLDSVESLYLHEPSIAESVVAFERDHPAFPNLKRLALVNCAEGLGYLVKEVNFCLAQNVSCTFASSYFLSTNLLFLLQTGVAGQGGQQNQFCYFFNHSQVDR